ncbi:hypothetical protein C8R46DRAFT_1310497 [Mycena filopes]|nr:hypothetical protein C8R46DRAFT_1310497 [Mycena filopes]
MSDSIPKPPQTPALSTYPTLIYDDESGFSGRALLQSADPAPAITPVPTTAGTPGVLPFDSLDSFNEHDESFFVPRPPSTAAPAPAPIETAPAVTAPSETARGKQPRPASPAPTPSGSSLPAHPFHVDAGFTSGELTTKAKFTPKDHNSHRENTVGLLVAGTRLHNRVDRLLNDFADLSGQVGGLTGHVQEITSAARSTGGDQISVEVLDAQNSLSTRTRGLEVAVHDLNTRAVPALFERLQAVEGTIARLEGLMVRLTGSVDTLITAGMGRFAPPTLTSAPAPAPTVSTAPVIAPPALPVPAFTAPPTQTAPLVTASQAPAAPAAPALDTATLDAYFTAREKRARDEAEDASRNVRPRTQPPAPALAAPYVFQPSAPPAMPAPPPPATARAPPKGAKHPPAPAYVPPAPPVPAVDSNSQVVYGPHPQPWTRTASGRMNVHADVSRAILDIIPSAVGYSFSTRPYGSREHAMYTVLTFAGADIADWMVEVWGEAPRGTYTATYMVHPNA